MNLAILRSIYDKPALKEVVLLKSDLVDPPKESKTTKRHSSNHVVARHNSAVKRREELLRVIKSKGGVSMLWLLNNLTSAEKTIRNDTDALCKRGLIKRFYDGLTLSFEYTG